MVFIRKKRIKKKSRNIYEYAYLVENKWMKRPRTGKRGVRQKVMGFLGRSFRFEPVHDVGFFEYLNVQDVEEYVNAKEFHEIVEDLLKWEFFKHNVSEEFRVKLKEKSVLRNDKGVALEMNEGFLCNYTLGRLLNRVVKPGEDAGYVFANAFVEAGIKIPKELFVKVYEKVF